MPSTRIPRLDRQVKVADGDEECVVGAATHLIGTHCPLPFERIGIVRPRRSRSSVWASQGHQSREEFFFSTSVGGLSASPANIVARYRMSVSLTR